MQQFILNRVRNIVIVSIADCNFMLLMYNGIDPYSFELFFDDNIVVIIRVVAGEKGRHFGVNAV